VSEKQKRIWKSRVPLLVVSTLIIITTYISLWSWSKVLSLAISNYLGREIFIFPFLFGKTEGVPLLLIPFASIVGIYGWLLSTRVKQFKTPRMRVFTFFNLLISLAGTLVGFGMTKVQQYVLPFFYARLDRVIDTSDVVNQVLFEQVQGFLFMLVLLPFIVFMFICFFLVTRYRQHEEELKKAFFKFQWRGERLRKFEKMGEVENEIPLPDIELGISTRTNEMVVLPGNDRTLNTVITGSIGTGKSAALAEPTINQDLHYFTRFMNDFPVVSQREDYVSKDVQGRYLNGLTVIEPSNDLCQKVYKLAKAHGIPDEAITYIDPTNPHTPSINVMQGPTEKVAEMFAQVLDGLQDNGGTSNFYFEQAQRNHLKMHIYLLKMHDPSIEVTFDMLIDMYNDTDLVHEMHMKLKKRFPPDFEKIEDRDTYNYWQILKGVDKWFDNVVVPLEIKTPQGFQKVRDEHTGKIKYIDAFEQDVKGLRNILNDIGNNPLIRRVLFGKSKFNFDAHMGREGGILLVNTAKGELGELNRVLGKIILMSIQNAAFRREPYTSTYHHIVVDEAPEYLYSDFASFPAQSRKYKVILTILQQSLTQLRGAFGEDYMNAVVAAMRNRMVYADVSSFDAKYFSEMFGEKEVYKETESEQSISPLQESPVTRSGSNYSKVREARMSESDILYQEAFVCAVKIVVNNQTMPVEQIKANFVSDEEYERASVQVNPEVIDYWIEQRFKNNNNYNKELIDIADVTGMTVQEIPSVQSVDDSVVMVDEGMESSLNPDEMERAIRTLAPSKPRGEDVQYDKPNLSAVTIPYISKDPVPVKVKDKIVESSESVDDAMNEMKEVKPLESVSVVVPNQAKREDILKKEDVTPLESVTLPNIPKVKQVETELEFSIEKVASTDIVEEFTFVRRPKQLKTATATEQSIASQTLAQVDQNIEMGEEKEDTMPLTAEDVSEYKEDQLTKDIEQFYKEVKKETEKLLQE